MDEIHVREAQTGDEDQLAALMAALWPDGSAREHRDVAGGIVRRRICGTLPATFFLAVAAPQKLIGFIQVGLRSHADGCDPARPVAFIEGWYVEDGMRGRGVGRTLMEEAESWARSLHCQEVASDALLDNQPSLRAHSALGFEVVDRCIHFRKKL